MPARFRPAGSALSKPNTDSLGIQEDNPQNDRAVRPGPFRMATPFVDAKEKGQGMDGFYKTDGDSSKLKGVKG
jgi:hypothetical protein